MRKRGREAWLDDIRASQRNVVFPDTVQNEGRFWRNILSGKGRFTITQVVGIGLMYLTMGGVIGIAVYQKVHNSSATGSLFNRLVTNFGNWIVLFSIFGVLFLLLRWRVRRALSTATNRNQADKE